MNYPKSRKEQVRETFFGVEISDPYRWMEDQDSPEVAKWVDEQIACTEEYLSKIPNREELRKRLEELYHFDKYLPGLMILGDGLVFGIQEGLNNQPTFYLRDKEGTKLLLDPNTMSEDGTKAFSISGATTDGKFVGLLSAEAGSDWQVMHIFDVKNRKMCDDVIQNIKFTNTAWYRDGFFYSGYDIPDDKRDLSSLNSEQTVFYHKMGTSQKEDRKIYSDPENPLRYLSLDVSEDERHLVLTISAGTSGTEIRYKSAESGEDAPFVTIFEGFSHDYYFSGCEGDELFFLTNRDASNMRILSYHTVSGEIRETVAESSFFIDQAIVSQDKILMNCSRNAMSRLFIFNRKDSSLREVELPSIGSVLAADFKKDRAYYSLGSFLMPTHHYALDVDTGKSALLHAPKLPFRSDDYVTEQKFFRSKDGTEVPMFLTHKKGIVTDGSHPALIYGYGGFQISLTPYFSVPTLQLLENGFVHAVVNLRGGLEFGEEWHKAGMLDQKQNVFDDMIAASEYLIREGYTSADRLAIHGGSNGGLLVGAVVNQRPDLYAVSLPQVGVLDMLRFHKFTVGWGWICEYGNPEEEDDFRVILKYSPLHNIREMKYPATMILTADHDDRVVPAHSFKYGATLQEKADPSNPVLLHITKDAGHGAGNAVRKVIDERSDVIAFMLHHFAKSDR